MDVLGLGLSAVAIVVACLAWWSTHKQADASDRAADEAERATEIAAEALMVAKQAHDLEATRLLAELTPKLRLDPVSKRVGQVQQYYLTNDGPVRYEELVIDYRPTDLVLGFAVGNEQTEDILPVLREGPVEVGEQVLVSVYRDDAEHAGTLLLTVTARRADGEWEVVIPVELKRPPRVMVF